MNLKSYIEEFLRLHKNNFDCFREENLRLQRRLQLEMERREALCRHLSESESR
jgi:coiled-coil domain-containing protein 6